MRPRERGALADRPAEQSRDRDAVGFAGDIQHGVLDGGDGLLVQPAARLARQHMQMLGDLLELPRVAPNQNGG